MGRLNPKTICYGLMRAGGFLGFVAGVGATLSVAQNQFGVTLGPMVSYATMTRQQIVVGVIAVFAGFMGLLFGQALGASVPVRSDETCQSVDAVWHFSAYTVVVWVPVSGLLFGLAMGREAMKDYAQTHAYGEMVWLGFFLPVAVGCSIALILWFSVQVIPKVAGPLATFVMTNVSPWSFVGLAGSMPLLNSVWRGAGDCR